MTNRKSADTDAYLSVEELLTVVAYFAQTRSMMEAAIELAIPFERIRAIVEQLAATDQPGLFGVRAFSIAESASFNLSITPKSGLLTQPLALTAEEAAAVLLILETIEASADPETATAAQSAALKLRSAIGRTVPIVDSVSNDSGQRFAFSDQIYRALHERKVLKVRYRSSSGETSERELDCVSVYTVESTTYLRAVDRGRVSSRRQASGSRLDSPQKSFRVDRLEAAVVTDKQAGFHAPEPVDIRDPHAFGTESGASDWAKVLIDAEDTWIADYEPVFFTEEDCPDGFVAEIPMSNMDATASFVLRHSPSVKVLEPGRLQNAVVERATRALTVYGQSDKVSIHLKGR